MSDQWQSKDDPKLCTQNPKSPKTGTKDAWYVALDLPDHWCRQGLVEGAFAFFVQAVCQFCHPALASLASSRHVPSVMQPLES